MRGEGFENSTPVRRQFILNISLLLSMINKCDICGFDYEPTAHFCGGCNVDLREPGGSENVNIDIEPNKPKKPKAKESSKKKDSDNEDVIHWHSVRAMCNQYTMSFPNFFFLMMILGRGEKKLGFCDCASCNLGYREMLTIIANVTEKKKLTAQSREIIIKARGEQIDGHTIDFAKLIGIMQEKNGNEQPQEKQESIPQRVNHGKIVIEIDPGVLENAVFAVLKSERGQEAIRSVPRKNTKTRGVVR
jgi:hypothetical protein